MESQLYVEIIEARQLEIADLSGTYIYVCVHAYVLLVIMRSNVLMTLKPFFYRFLLHPQVLRIPIVLPTFRTQN